MSTTPSIESRVKKLRQFCELARQHGCPKDQVSNFVRAGIILQARQLAASAAARLCDLPDGPNAIGYGGARGGGKTHWLLAQIGADDCRRFSGLKCLLLRKVGKSNLENFEDLRRRLFHTLPHEFNASRGLLVFPNDSRIVLGHYQCEKDIDSYLGLEYDVIGIEEATQLTARKYEDISTCCRTSKPWRPRIYSTTNPGDIGHQWYLEKFIVPFEAHTESTTRFIPARVDDNAFINSDYKSNLANRTGWQYDAWYLGRWNFPAGQFFRNYRPEIHIFGHQPTSTTSNSPNPNLILNPPSPLNGQNASVKGETAVNHPDASATRQFYEQLASLHRFRESEAVEWFAAMDYGYTHLNVVLLGCKDHAGNLYVVDEHAERYWIPQRHASAVKAMFARHNVFASQEHLAEELRSRFPNPCSEREALWHSLQRRRLLRRFSIGTDAFANESNGETIAKQYRELLGIYPRPANMDRVSGWSAILQRLGDPDAGVLPSLFIHKRCTHLLECLPMLQHDPDRPGDILKTNINEEGVGGDDAADAFRYLVATNSPTVTVKKLRGL
jgi:hypothetical protein